MADYLTNLAARALGLGPRVVPRPTSVFDPQPSVDIALAQDAHSSVESEQTTQVNAAPPRRTDLSVSESDAIAETQELERHTKPISTEDPPKPARAVAGPKPERTVVSSLALTPEPTRTAARAPVSLDEPLVAARVVSIEEKREILSTVRKTLVQEKTILLHETVVQEKPSGTAHPPTRVARQANPTPNPLLVVPSGKAAPSFAQPAHQAPVTVEVTIGRIEVRAINPPPLQQRPPGARRQPALPLDEYLKQRNRGGQ
jgi:hypothetical protein